MELQVSTEVEPAVFQEADLAAAGARIVRRVHIGWLSVAIDAGRLAELRRVRGVLGTLVVTACEEPGLRGLEFAPLGEAAAPGVLALTLEAGRADGRVVALRLRATALQTCFVRCHRTAGLDIAVLDGPSGSPVLARHSDGLRDESRAGMHDWAGGTEHSIAMWVGHLRPGEATVEAGVLGGFVRVQGRPQPLLLTAPLRLG